jgi:hypothetical protein
MNECDLFNLEILYPKKEEEEGRREKRKKKEVL